MKRVICLILLGALLAAGEATPITTSTVAGAEVVTITVPSKLMPPADLKLFGSNRIKHFIINVFLWQ